jgi:hypothetical protein
MTLLAASSMKQIADELARALVRSSSRDDTVRLSLPLLYPGGSMVGVELSRLRDGFLVSDVGAARREAGMLGGERSFQRIAYDVAQRFGIRFDQNMMFDLDVAEGDLLSAVIAVANAAKTAVENTAIHMATAEHADHRAYLWDKLQFAFGTKAFHREPIKFKGSTESWDFDASVRIGSSVALFEVVTPNANSVNSAVTKFLDVRDLGEQIAPKRVAVLTNRDKTPRLLLLGRTARTLDADATEEDYRNAA